MVEWRDGVLDMVMVARGGLAPGWREGLGRIPWRRLPFVVSVMLVVLLAVQAADLTWKVIAGLDQEAPAVVEQETTTEAVSKVSGDPGKALAALHLFGQPAPQTAVEQRKEAVADAPETRLNLTLHGVFVDHDPTRGAAIIAKPGSGQLYYRVGREVANGRVLREVYADRVILAGNRGLETLRFPKKVEIEVPEALSRTAASKAGARDLTGLKGMLEETPEKVLDYLRFLPVKTGGQLRGFRILPKRDRTLYNKLGLQPADIVTAVNGIPLSDEMQALQLIDDLGNAGQLVLQVERRGQTRTVTLDLQ